MRAFESEKGESVYNIVHVLTKLMMIIVGIGICSYAYYYFFNNGKEEDFLSIKTKFESISNIKVIHQGYKDDGVALTRIFTTFKTSNNTVITLSDLRPEILEDLGTTTFLRFKDWGIVTLKIAPKKDDIENILVFTNGIRLKLDKDFLTYFEKNTIHNLGDILKNIQQLNRYILSLPELNQEVISEEFYRKNVQLKDTEYGFEGKDHILRWRFKTNHLGDLKKSYGDNKMARPDFPMELIKKIRREIKEAKAKAKANQNEKE